MNTKGLVERRKHKRFEVLDGGFAVFMPDWSHFAISGKIIDISRDGLAFLYLTNEDRSNAPFELDILSAYHGFWLGMLPVKTISDFEIADEGIVGSITTKRCGTQFGELTQKQMSQLEYFIGNFTVGEESERHKAKGVRRRAEIAWCIGQRAESMGQRAKRNA